MNQDNNELYIPRFVEKKLIKSLQTPIITMITGARQVGKSTLLSRLSKYAEHTFGNKNNDFSFETNTFMYTLDDIPLRAQLKKDITYIQKDIELGLAQSLTSVNRPVFIFIDEIQKYLPLLDWIKQIYDVNSKFIKFVITGSSVTGFSKHLTETLAGRIEFVHLTPISLAELYSFRFKIDKYFFNEMFLITESSPLAEEELGDALSYNPEGFLDDLEKDDNFDLLDVVPSLLNNIGGKLRKSLKSAVGTYLEHLFYGGMPKIYTVSVPKRRDILSSYITVYLEREVGYVARNIDLELFGLSLSSFARFNGMPINIQEISKDVGIARPSIYRYLDLLEQTFLIKKIYPYPNSGKNKVKSMKLVYLDTGLLNVLLNIGDMKELVSSPFLKQVVLSHFVLDLWVFLSRYGISRNIYYWQDYEDHVIDLIVDFKDITLAFILDIPNKIDSRKFLTTIKNFAKHAKGKNIVLIHPIWNIKNFIIDITFRKLDNVAKNIDKSIYLLEAPVYFLV